MEYPEFAYALELGRELEQAWWRKQGRINLNNPIFQVSLWKANMTNRCRWIDGKTVGELGGTLRVEETRRLEFDLTKLSDKELEAFHEIMLAATGKEFNVTGNPTPRLPAEFAAANRCTE